MPEKTDQVQSSLAHCVGHLLGPLQLSPLSCLFNILMLSASFPACCKYFASRFIFSFSTTDFIVVFSLPKTFFVGLGSKCILQHGDLEFLLPGHILDMSMIRHVPWCTCVSVSGSDL